MNDLKDLAVIPAQAGYRIVYGDDDGTLFPAEAVVAWRIETYEDAGAFSSVTSPVTTNGEPDGNWMGLQDPEGKVTWMGDEYRDIETASDARMAYIAAQD